jgi:hypothetical protein
MTWSHGIIAFFPVHRANFTEFLEMLERINDAQALTDRAAEGHIVNDLVTDDSGFIDEEKSAIRDEFAADFDVSIFIFDILTCEYIVVFGDGFVNISDERIGDTLNSAVFARGLKPSPVREFRIRGTTDDGNIALFKLTEFFLKTDELRRANEGEIFWVEKENNVLFPDELFEGETLDDGFALNGFGVKIRGGFAYENGHSFECVSNLKDRANSYSHSDAVILMNASRKA